MGDELTRLLRAPQTASYALARWMYRGLPAPARNWLGRPRDWFIRTAQQRSQPGRRQAGDLTWAQFRAQVLAGRERFRGIFISEPIIDWNVPLFQRPQHMAMAMAGENHLVIYKTRNWAGDAVTGFREIAANVWLTDRSEVDRIPGAVRAFYSTSPLHSPATLRARRSSGKIVYEYIDHIDPAISGDAENIRRLVALRDYALAGGVDLVVASARRLSAEAAVRLGTDRVVLVPNGVDVAHYRDPRHLHTAPPPPLAAFRRRYLRLVGYFGAIAPWLWYAELQRLVCRRPDLGFVFIGPDYYGGAARLPQADNVLWLGAVDYRVLPACARVFDVCLIPFVPGEIARTTSPLKLYEYFALEKPVVVTSAMDECVSYPEVLHGDAAEAWSARLDEAFVSAGSAAFRQRLAMLAEENSWQQRAKAYSRAVTR